MIHVAALAGPTVWLGLNGLLWYMRPSCDCPGDEPEYEISLVELRHASFTTFSYRIVLAEEGPFEWYYPIKTPQQKISALTVLRLMSSCGLEVDEQLVFGRRLHGQVGGLLTLEDAIACCDCVAKSCNTRSTRFTQLRPLTSKPVRIARASYHQYRLAFASPHFCRASAGRRGRVRRGRAGRRSARSPGG
jgi:hypothetical protein